MTGILLTQASTPIIGQIAWALGKLMDGIFIVLDSLFGVQNIGLSIIIFTIVIYTLMLPLTIKQQKFTKLSSVMNPEIQKVQAKYKGKKDQVSMQKQQDEMQAVYQKYGTSPTGGCSQLLIQMPILFGLYQVIRNIPAYVGAIKEGYMPLVEGIMNTSGYQAIMENIGSQSTIAISPSSYDYTQANTIVDVLYKFQTETWVTLTESFPSLETLITSTQQNIEHLNSFLGINIANAPLSIVQENFSSNMMVVIVAIMIPVFSGITQYLSIQISQSGQTMDQDNPMASSMKTMNTTMPLLSVFMCFTLPAGLGLYWIASAVVRTVQQVVINKYLNKIPLEDMIKKNQEKAAKKREKKGTSASKLNEMAQKSARNIENQKRELQSNISEEERSKQLAAAAKAKENAKEGSLASKANLVKQYNEGSKK